MSKVVSVEGPIELINGELMIRIPMSMGGDVLAPLATEIGQVVDGNFCVVIKPWLAEKLRIMEGSIVIVDNVNGKFTITRSAINDEIN